MDVVLPPKIKNITEKKSVGSQDQSCNLHSQCLIFSVFLCVEVLGMSPPLTPRHLPPPPPPARRRSPSAALRGRPPSRATASPSGRSARRSPSRPAPGTCCWSTRGRRGSWPCAQGRARKGGGKPVVPGGVWEEWGGPSLLGEGMGWTLGGPSRT